MNHEIAHWRDDHERAVATAATAATTATRAPTSFMMRTDESGLAGAASFGSAICTAIVLRLATRRRGK